MSEELLQRDLIKNPQKIGTWKFYNIGATTISALKNAGIIRSVDYEEVSRKKVDGIITKQKEVIAIVEYKTPQAFNTQTKRNKAILQEIEVAKKLKTKLIIVTDTYETIWINVATSNHVKDQDGNDLKYNFEPNDKNLQKIITQIIQSINSTNDKILPKELIDPTGLAKSIWQDVWSVSGATPENCLYTFVELFIFKYLSDLGILERDYSFDELLKKDKKLDYYAKFIRPEIKRLFPESHFDKTTIINGTIFVNKDQKAVSGYDTVFRKVLEKFRDFGKLEHIDHDFKSKLFESFLKESISKKNWGQFFTPISVVRAINDMASSDFKEGMKICDPACGVGKFPLEYIKNNLHALFEIKDGEVKSQVKIIGFDKGFDNDEKKTIILAKANMLIYFCELIKDNPEYTEDFANLFNESFKLKTNSILGTLSEPIKNEYDLILTNPPYVTSGSSNLKEEISKNHTLKNYYKTNAMGVEGLFMEWIIKALKPNGKAFVVVPDGIFNRQNDTNLRKYILDECIIEAIISLPIKTFFSTPKKTYILAVTKKQNKSVIQMDPVFTYICSEIGESRDVNRFEIEANDLQESVELFKSFKGNKKGFAKLNTDERCKIQPIDLFIKNIDKNWSIEKFWTEEERTELGLSLDNDISSIQDFKNNIQNISDELSLMIQEINAIEPEQDILYKNFTLEDVLSPSSGNQCLKKSFIEKNKGEFPVYSSNTKENGLFGYINTYDYDVECVQITTNGVYAGTVFYRAKHKFSINSDARLYIPKKQNLDCLYLSYELQRVLSKNNFSWEYKPTIVRTKYLQVKIPVTKEGSFDLKKQQELAEKYRKVEEIKKNLKEELEKIANIKVDISI